MNNFAIIFTSKGETTLSKSKLSLPCKGRQVERSTVKPELKVSCTEQYHDLGSQIKKIQT